MAKLNIISPVNCPLNEGTAVSLTAGAENGVALEVADAYIAQNTGTGEATVTVVAGDNPRGAAENLEIKIAASAIAVISLDSGYWMNAKDIDGVSRRGCITVKSPAAVKFAPVYIR